MSAEWPAVPVRRWWVPSPAHKAHLFSVRTRHGQSFCGKHSESATRLLREGTVAPTRDACRTCTRELDLASGRLRGSR